MAFTLRLVASMAILSYSDNKIQQTNVTFWWPSNGMSLMVETLTILISFEHNFGLCSHKCFDFFMITMDRIRTTKLWFPFFVLLPISLVSSSQNQLTHKFSSLSYERIIDDFASTEWRQFAMQSKMREKKKISAIGSKSHACKFVASWRHSSGSVTVKKNIFLYHFSRIFRTISLGCRPLFPSLNHYHLHNNNLLHKIIGIVDLSSIKFPFT